MRGLLQPGLDVSVAGADFVDIGVPGGAGTECGQRCGGRLKSGQPDPDHHSHENGNSKQEHQDSQDERAAWEGTAIVAGH